MNVKYVAGEKLRAGDFVRIDASGRLVKASSGDTGILGTLPEIVSIDGDVIEVPYRTIPRI